MSSLPASSSQTAITTETRLLRDRNFLLLWLAQIISSLGDWALLVVLPVAVYNGTGSKTALGLSMLFGTVPVLLFALLGGVFADRWDRRRTMVVVDLGRALAVLLLLGITGNSHYGPRDLALIYAVAFLVASFSCFFSPARSGLLAALLPREQLLQANGLFLFGMQFTLMIGPALGGLLLAWLHPRGVFVFDAATFLASAVCVGMITKRGASAQASAVRGTRGLWKEAAEGIGYVWNSPLLRPALLLLSVAVLAGYVNNTLEFAFVRDIWGGTGRQYGLLVSMTGLATVITNTLCSGQVRSVPPARLMLPGFLIMAAGGLVFAEAQTLWLGGAMLFVMGIGNTFVTLGLATLFQLTAPSHLQGRVSGTISVINRLSMTSGGALAILLTALFPSDSALRLIFAGVAVSYFLCGILAWLLLPPAEAIAAGETL